MMATSTLTQILYLFDDAFAGHDWHSVLINLRAVTPDEWLWVPPDGRRSIRYIVRHVGVGKYIYQNHAFGDASFTWKDLHVVGDKHVETVTEAIAWLRQGHENLRASIAALDDEELLRPRLSPFDGLKETRWIIARMMQHDLYHAGEINHILALRRQDD
ncbi:MAG TPA: DinB family protein [Chloroflexia bacterium]|nr:DinB family protein [Chloroflexia bacterium]